VSRLTGVYSSPFLDGIPGPYISARVTRGDGGEEFRDLRALLDTGADITLIPQITIEALSLQLVTDDLELHDGTGRVIEDAKMYRADIQIGELPIQTVGISPTDAAVIYIGRDMLSDYVAMFHGPGQSFSLDRPD
jgi:predicted aspartyl protease